MKYYTIIFFSILVFAGMSCKKLIEIKETNFIGGDIALQTVANNEQGIIGAYAGLGTEMGILMNATFSDEVKKAEFYNSATTHEWQYTSTDITIRDNFTAFPLYYRIIDRVNRVLQALPKADSTKSGDETLRARLRGEALFLRAFCHFELFRYYCANYDPAGVGLAYMEVPSLEPKVRIAMGPYFTKLNADLAEAKTLLPNNLTDVLRATRLAASGLQARIALYTRDWPNAIAFSTEYITGLPLSPRASFTGIWTDANTNEVAFKLKRSTGTRIGSLFRGTSSKSGVDTLVGTITWAPSDKIWNSFDQVNDIRFSSYLKDEPLLIKQGRPSHLIQKYAGTAYTSASENVADGKIFRTGEMYLIRAEAKAETNDLAGAAADINALRTARITGYTNISYASKDLAITDIMLERFKELAFESHRFWDLKRRNLPVERLSSDAPSTSATTLAAGNFRFILPIPNSEIQANKLITQNPGYTN
jgi:hypothetical protein